jgi:hypothetical protein
MKKCKCPSPKLIGKEVKFMKIKGGDKIQARDYRVKCLACGCFYGWMSGENFKIMKVPIYDQLLG